MLVLLAAGLAKRFGGACKPLAPLGLQGEAVIDLTVGDARRAGFGDVVLVLGPQTGPAIEYHVRRTWPASVPVSFPVQEVPLGTAHAVLCARRHIGERHFAVVNGDDVYGADALGVLARHLDTEPSEHALIGFRLDASVATDEPVTRGTCQVGDDGLLLAIAERKLVQRQPDGTFRAGDGRQPEQLPGDTPVSMNCWGLRPTVWPVLEEAVRGSHPEVAADGTLAAPVQADHEVLLPEVIGAMVEGRTTGGVQPVRVLRDDGRCVGITHAEDLPVVRAELATMVARGLRPADPWEGVR